MKTLCVALMVKNEAKVIVRCLASVKDLADYIFIVDTGSTDNTIEIIKNYFSENNIKGEVIERPWINFGVNKTETIHLIKNKFDYVLWLDADDVIISDNFDKNKLTADSYYVSYDGKIDYCQLRIFNNKLDWKCVGVVHTYAYSSEAKTQEKLKELKIKTYNDGSTQRNDIKILEEALKKEPNNTRYWFYLAQSYKEAKNYQKAINCYLKRISLGGWSEEIFYSYYKIAISFETLGKIKEAIANYLNAFNYRPTRAEPLYRLSVLYRKQHKYNLAYLFAQEGLKIPYPSDLLFVEKNVYNYFLLFEKSISSYYIGHYKESYNDSIKILQMDGVSEIIKKQTKTNLKIIKAHGNL